MGQGYSGKLQFVVDSRVPGVSKDSMGFGDSRVMGTSGMNVVSQALSASVYPALPAVWGDGSCRAEQRKKGCWNRYPNLKRTEFCPFFEH